MLTAVKGLILSCLYRLALQRFLVAMHQEVGGFIMHRDGELDIR